MPQLKDLSGMQFGRWVVMHRDEDHIIPSGSKVTMWLCRCSCGTVKSVSARSLISGRSKSCGCDKSKMATICSNNFRKHGETKTRLYQIWAGMRKRCNDENSYNYELYGGRGIKVCDKWNDYLEFKQWAIENGYNDDLSIDRIDVNGDYTPENCRWTDRITQNNNRRSNVWLSYNNESHTIAEWSRILGIPYKQLHKKLGKGLKIEDILSA